MHPNLQKEQFSIAYVRAVTSVAGVKVTSVEVDDDSIDVMLERSGDCTPKLDLQLKCTAQPIPEEGDLSYALNLKNYEDLRKETLVPRWLVVLFVPEKVDGWLECSASDITLRHCAWWTSLAQANETENTTSVTIHLPRVNLFTPEAIIAKLDEVATQFRAFQPNA